MEQMAICDMTQDNLNPISTCNYTGTGFFPLSSTLLQGVAFRANSDPSTRSVGGEEHWLRESALRGETFIRVFGWSGTKAARRALLNTFPLWMETIPHVPFPSSSSLRDPFSRERCLFVSFDVVCWISQDQLEC